MSNTSSPVFRFRDSGQVLTTEEVEFLRQEERSKRKSCDVFLLAGECLGWLRAFSDVVSAWRMAQEEGKTQPLYTIPRAQRLFLRLVELLPLLWKAVKRIPSRSVPGRIVPFRFAGGPREDTAAEATASSVGRLMYGAYATLLHPSANVFPTECPFPKELEDLTSGGDTTVADRVIAEGFTPKAMKSLAALNWPTGDDYDSIKFDLRAEKKARQNREDTETPAAIGKGAAGSGIRTGRRPGRPSDTDPEADARLYEQWRQSGETSFERFEMQRGLRPGSVLLARDRHRHRTARLDGQV